MSLIPLFATFMRRLSQFYCFDEHNLLVPTQFGFWREKSTVLAVESFVEEIPKYFETKKSTQVILCGLSHTFDFIPHKVLLIKLKHYGLGESALKVLVK